MFVVEDYTSMPEIMAFAGYVEGRLANNLPQLLLSMR